MHWNRSSSCDYPPLTDFQREMLTGVLMGDGDIHHRHETNPLFRVRMTSKPFIEHIDSFLGPLSKGMFLDRDAEGMSQQAVANQKEERDGVRVVNEENYNDLYGVRSCSHPEMREFAEWYSNGEKRFPDDLTLTPTILKYWYACDGWLASEAGCRDRLWIKCTNESDRPEYLMTRFHDVGFDSANVTRHSIYLNGMDTLEALQWMGDAPPGFEYKWAVRDRRGE